MSRPLKIVVAGYIVGFPLGGMVWALLAYLVPLARMGHEVLFLEDSSTWSYPYDPMRRVYSADSTHARGLITRMLGRFGLERRWAYHSQIEGRHFGLPEDEVARFCREADLLLNISGLIPLREPYTRPRVKAFLDTDPVFTQVKAQNDPGTLDYLLAHDHHFTFGYNLPRGHTPVPMLGLNWKPYLPPVMVDEWTPVPEPGRRYTTIGTWETKDRELDIGGVRYSWRKSVEYDKIFELPRLARPHAHFELAYSNMVNPEARFIAGDWIIRDGIEVSVDPDGYRDYIRHSRAELTVAKEQNVKLKSGWFSDRSASYLAAGRPVITQDCGFDRYLPVGQGLFAFETLDDILTAVERIESDYPRHCQAARRLATDHFDATRIMAGLLREMDLA